MGRIREYIKVNGKKCWTMFDSGARNTYVVPAVAALLDTFKLPKAFKSALGGSRKVTIVAMLIAEVQGRQIFTNAGVIDDLGEDETGKPIEILLGILAMKQWGIRLAQAANRLDLTHYPETFVEF